MTAVAALVAEALAFAEANTDGTYAPSRFCVIRTDLDYVREPEWGGAVPESFAKPGGSRVAYGRADFTLTALAHLATRAAEAEGRAERAEAALDAAEREASLRLDRISILRLGFEEGHPVLAVDDAAASERVRKYGPTVVTIDDGMRLAFQQPTPFDYGAGRSVRERVSAENPGARIRLWRLVCIEDWYRLPGEEAPHG